MIRAVLFDMDGTLLDSEKLYRTFWSQGMDELGLVVDKDEFFSIVSGRTVAGMREDVLKRYGEDFPFEELNTLRRARLMEYLESNLPSLKPGVPQIFPTLHRMGIKIVLATSSGLAYAKKLLERLEIDGYFDAMMTGERVTNSKPDPEIFLKAASLVGVEPLECVVVEDSHNGVRAGYAAGMRTVMVPDLQPCTKEICALLWHRIDSLEDLPALIEKFNLESENT